MRYSKKTNTIKGSNVSLDMNDLSAYSYGWWQFVKVVNDTVIFNDYPYSRTTRRHQSKVRSVLSANNISIGLTVLCPRGLQDANWEADTIAFYKKQISLLEEKLNNPRCRSASLNLLREQGKDGWKSKIMEVMEWFGTLKRIIEEE